MKLRSLVKSSCILFLLASSGLHAASDKLPEVTVDGLHRLSDTELAIVYAKPGADLSQYNRVFLADAYVAFKKNWKRDQNTGGRLKVTTSDMEKMKTGLAALFKEVFTETLVEGGYEMATERADDVLIIKPAIINLDVVAPDTTSASMGRSRTYSESTGEMTLYLELFDSVTDDLLAKALDRQFDRETGYFQWQTSVTNRAAANRILKQWANVLKEGLDEARSAKAE
jgi:hypothetical protein